jgi:hypothetical protein
MSEAPLYPLQGDTAGAKAALLRAEALAPRFPAIKEQRVRPPRLPILYEKGIKLNFLAMQLTTQHVLCK